MRNLDEKTEIKKDPYQNANIFSKLCFWWVLPLLYKGFNEDIRKADINEQISSLKCEELTKKFYVKWHQMMNKGNFSIIKLMRYFYGTSYIISTLLHIIIELLCKITQVICLGGLTSYFTVNQNNVSKVEAYSYAAGLVISILLLSLTTNIYILYVTHIGLRIRLGCSGLVYKKIIENKKYISGFNGRAIQIITNDMKQLIFGLTFGNVVILGPAETCALGYLMFQEIGFSAICGILICLIFLPLQFLSARRAGKYMRAKSKQSDTRLKLLTEMIQGIQVIKMFSWENWFYNSLIKIRKLELTELWGSLKIRAGVNSLRMVSVIAVFVSLLSHIYFGNQLSARKVFITSLIFSLINSSMIRFWTISLTYSSEACTSANRIREFLIEGIEYKRRIDSDKTKLINEYVDVPDKDHFPLKIIKKHFETQEIGIQINHVIVKRKSDQKDEKIVLNDINLQINQNNNLIAIVGLVGSGKSTLLNLILGELIIESGLLKVNGKVSYSSQQPWIFEGTIQENILFTETMDEERYSQVIKACALEKDLETFSRKDLTYIGERGINLSGGQKARINLARAIYKTADIYLLDDPFSSVDVEVGQHIFEKCISEFLSGKICVLVTHQLKYLENNVNQVIVMKSGCIELQGSFKDLQTSNKLKFLSNIKKPENSNKIILSEYKILNDKKHTDISDYSREEKIETGAVKATIYKSLLRLIGWWLVGSTLVLAILSTVSLNGLSYFLKNWIDWEESQINATHIDYVNNVRHFYELEYLIVVTITLFLNISRYFFICYACMKISRNIFITLLKGVMQAYMYFFNINSSGRIINRFSNDLGLIDGQLSIILQNVIALFTDVPAAAIVICIINPWLLIPSILVIVPFYFIRTIYIKTSRNIKRIDALAQSPINSHVNETFQGLATIRTSKAEIKMAAKFYKYQDFSASTYFFDASIYRCFTLWIDIVCFLYIAIIAFTFLKYEYLFTSGDVGLAIFLCMSTVQTLQFAIKFSTNFENQLTSVERIIEYANQPIESTLTNLNNEIDWPLNGSIEFKNFSLKYGTNETTILKNLNFKIKSEEKVAIVGRTGGGKSSIIQAILRLASNDGKIEIDGMDINNLALTELRSKISVIPQDPILFSGTIRSNLDPSEILPDLDLWNALNEVELKEQIKSLNQGLDCEILEHGSNFSVGERQLLCLARAILRNNKILILDEATANVDSLTDALICKTLQNKFKNSTVITITHRLERIIDYDRIMVVDNGNVVEFDTFENLKNNTNSYFNNLFKNL